jgi:hypothetical protein
MGSRIAFYCGNQDHQALQAYAQSIGLKAIAPEIDKPLKEPADGRMCYLLPITHKELHPYGEPKTLLTDVKDPMLFFMRGYFSDPYLLLGQLGWNDLKPELAAITKPYYQKLLKWIKANWEKSGDIYIGSEAKLLIEKGAQKVNSIPGAAEFNIVHY